MYYVSDQKAVKSLVAQARDIQTKVNSSMFLDEAKTENIFDKEIPILENVEVKDLINTEDCIIIYSKKDLTEELNDIIRIYKYIPQICNKKYDVVKIYFELGQQKIMMSNDPNDQDICNYKRIQALCKEHDLPFRN